MLAKEPPDRLGSAEGDDGNVVAVEVPALAASQRLQGDLITAALDDDSRSAHP